MGGDGKAASAEMNSAKPTSIPQIARRSADADEQQGLLLPQGVFSSHSDDVPSLSSRTHQSKMLEAGGSGGSSDTGSSPGIGRRGGKLMAIKVTPLAISSAAPLPEAEASLPRWFLLAGAALVVVMLIVSRFYN